MPCEPTRDRELIRLQLGRLRYEPDGVVARCYRDYPAAVRAFASRTGDPARMAVSTTLDWLTCPWLSQRVAGLESRGWIEHLRWIVDHPASGELRDALMAEAGRYTTRLRQAFDGRFPGLFTRRFGDRTMGIGGTARPLGLKCLHSHVAAALAGGESPIGAFVLGLVSLDLAPQGRGPLDCGRDCAAQPSAFGLAGPEEV